MVHVEHRYLYLYMRNIKHPHFTTLPRGTLNRTLQITTKHANTTMTELRIGISCLKLAPESDIEIVPSLPGRDAPSRTPSLHPSYPPLDVGNPPFSL